MLCKWTEASWILLELPLPLARYKHHTSQTLKITQTYHSCRRFYDIPKRHQATSQAKIDGKVCQANNGARITMARIYAEANMLM